MVLWIWPVEGWEWGVVVRDHTGEFVVAECRRYEHITDPGTAELLACRDAVMLAKARGWTHVVVETDCQLLVAASEKNEGHMPASNQVLREMKTTVSNFQGFRF
jgi:ribonuclease HI